MKISTQKNNKENAPAYLLAKLVRSIGRRLSQRIRQLFYRDGSIKIDALNTVTK